MSESANKKKGLWGLLRSSIASPKYAKATANGAAGGRGPRREGDGTGAFSQSRSDAAVFDDDDDDDDDDDGGFGDGPRRHYPSHGRGKGKGLASDPEPGPLTGWPPSGMSSEEELALLPAMELISAGAPAFNGHEMPVPHASDGFYALFATVAADKDDDTDATNLHDAMVQLTTLRLLGSGPATYPWETLEQPSGAFYYGTRPGTVTVTQWISAASVIPPSIELRDPGVAPREVELEAVLGRLRELQRYGLEDDDADLMYKNLYRRLLRDPDKRRPGATPHTTLDRQITDLIMVLSRADWVDLSQPRNQIVTKYFFNTQDPAGRAAFCRFFHQLLLSVELEARINSGAHREDARTKLLAQLPPRIQWDLALAQRWRQNMRVEAWGAEPADLALRSRLRRRQVKMLRRFAQMLKWPNLDAALANLRRRDADDTLDQVSSHASAFFWALVLPGSTFPFVMMNALVDIDPDPATDALALLTHLHPQCGFQYKGIHTYWTAASVVGKVLAPTCLAVGGWVGPARPTTSLGRSQIARVRSRRPPRRPPTPEETISMAERTDPLGPPADVYPVSDYTLVLPGVDDKDRRVFQPEGDVVVRIGQLVLRPCEDMDAEQQQQEEAQQQQPAPASPQAQPNSDDVKGTGSPPSGVADAGVAAAAATAATAAAKGPGHPRCFDAFVNFAIHGETFSYRLTHDVSFINAWPCSEGRPHPLFIDYDYARARAEELISLRGWNGPGGTGQSVVPLPGHSHSHDNPDPVVTPPEPDSPSGALDLEQGRQQRRHHQQEPSSPRAENPPHVQFPEEDAGEDDGEPAPAAAEAEDGAGDSSARTAADPEAMYDAAGTGEYDENKVLMVEAFGTPDYEVLARAWCSFWGLSAVVADVKRTCCACAIREAYAATINVVIMVDDQNGDSD